MVEGMREGRGKCRVEGRVEGMVEGRVRLGRVSYHPQSCLSLLCPISSHAHTSTIPFPTFSLPYPTRLCHVGKG